MGSSCSSAIETASYSRSGATATDTQRKILDKFDQYKLGSDTKIISSQNIEINDTSSIASDIIYQGKRYKRNFLGMIVDECPEFGCGYSINQNTELEIFTINKTIINEAENIFNEISSDVSSSSSTGGGGGTAVDDATSESLNEATDYIRSELESLSKDSIKDKQNIVLNISSPIRREGDCPGRCPVIEQTSYYKIKAENIINKVTEIIEKNKREHGVESSAEVEGEDNTECILNLLICACCCIMSLIILWKFAL